MVHKLSRSELVSLVERIINVEGTEEEIDEMLFLLQRNVPDPEVLRMVRGSEDLSAEQIVDRALNYKPIILPARMDRPTGAD